MVIQDKIELNEKEKNLIKFLKSEDFPFFWHNEQVKGDEISFLGHCLIGRVSQKSHSPYTEDFLSIFKKFTEKNNISYKKIFRAHINLTFPIPNCKETFWHKDHEFDHKQFIMYMNDADGNTELKIEDNIFCIKPAELKAVTFGNVLHRAILPSKGRRIVFVLTYI